MAIDGVQITRLPNGKYLVKDEFNQDGFEATQEEITNAYGITAEQINIFVAEQEASNAPDEPVINGGKPNSVFTAKAKANTGLANANDKIQTEDDYARMEKEYAEALKTRVGYGDADAAAHAKGMVQTQRAADRVEASVYFTPNQKEEYEKQKKELEAQGKRPVLLTEEDMQLLKSPEFVLRDKQGDPVDVDGNVIDKNDPDAAKKYVTAFNEDGTLNQDMVKLISAQRVGSDNELELEERDAETRDLTAKTTKKVKGGKVTRDNAKPAADLYERLGYDVQKDDVIEADPNDLKKARNRGRLWGALVGVVLYAGSVISARLLSKTKTNEKVRTDTIEGEEHTLPDTTLPGETHEVTTDVTVSVTYVTPGEHHEHDDVGPGGTVHYEWNDPDVTTTVTTVVSTTQTITDPDITVPGQTYTDPDQEVDIYEERDKYGLSWGEALVPGAPIIPLAMRAGAKTAENKARAKAVAQAVDDKVNDILGGMDHREFVGNVYDKGDYSGVIGDRNQQMMKYVVDKAKEKNMSKDEFMQFMKYAQGSNECLTEKELLNMFNLIDDYKVPPKKEPDPVKPSDYATLDSVTTGETNTTVERNRAYKMKRGETPLNVIKAKYHITDNKEAMKVLREVRKRMGIPESGVNNGKVVIPEIEVDSEIWKDAYFLPPNVLGYELDFDAPVPLDPKWTTGDGGSGTRMRGNNEERTNTTDTRKTTWIVRDSKGNELHRSENMQEAIDYMNKYNAEHNGQASVNEVKGE